MNFRPATRHGERCYVANDASGREWKIYKSRMTRRWHFIREDHDVSSIGYTTMADAQAAIDRLFAMTEPT